ncbi:hypothetical protein M2266_003422 [Streptomyces sp. SPB162]|nr:hypothetical protein [Streptomyces sp. SPB162]
MASPPARATSRSGYCSSSKPSFRAVRLPPTTMTGGSGRAKTVSSSLIKRSCWPKVADTPRMSGASIRTRAIRSSRVTPNCMSARDTVPRRVERAARATSEMPNGKRGSGKYSGWYRAASSTRGRLKRPMACSSRSASDSQDPASARWRCPSSQAGQTRVSCGCPDRSATTHCPSARSRSVRRRSSVPVTWTRPVWQDTRAERSASGAIDRPCMSWSAKRCWPSGDPASRRISRSLAPVSRDMDWGPSWEGGGGRWNPAAGREVTPRGRRGLRREVKEQDAQPEHTSPKGRVSHRQVRGFVERRQVRAGGCHGESCRFRYVRCEDHGWREQTQQAEQGHGQPGFRGSWDCRVHPAHRRPPSCDAAA